MSSGKKRARQNRIVRIVIQTFFFLLAPSVFTTAFAGIKQFFTMVHAGEPLVLNGFFKALIALCLFTMLFGRFFCGYACAFGSLGDFVYFLREKIGKKTGVRIPRLPDGAAAVMQHLPFLILLLIMLSCALGVYGRLSGWSPWEVFSLAMAGNIHLGGLVPGILIFLMILAGMALEPRFFCRFLCPMGAVFRLLPILPWAVLKRGREQCIPGCSACQKRCPVKHELGTVQNAGDCIRCGECADICPRGNISIGRIADMPLIGPKLAERNPAFAQTVIRGNDLIPTAAKAVLLFIIAAMIGTVRFI